MQPSITKLLLTTFLIHYVLQPTAATSLSTWIHTPPYQKGTLVEEIQCYSLPYGLIGFISHLLTYYTIALLSLQRSPWFPFRPNTHSRLDMIISLIGLVVAVTISSLTIVRCRSRWQFIAIAVWKLNLSVTYGFLSLHAAAILPKFEVYWDGGGRAAKVLFWLLLYIPSVGVGLTGLFSLVSETIEQNRNVMIITSIFGAVTLAVAIVVGLVVCCILSGNGSHDTILGPMLGSSLAACGVSLACFGVLGAFYSDWILAAIAENMVGVPSGDNAALYWSYFVAKRLPFFSA